MNQFSKMSTLGNKNSSTVIHLPPGILKSENASCDTSDSPVDHSYGRISSTIPEGPQTTNPKNAITEHKQSLPGSKVNPIVSFVMPKTSVGEPREEENTAVSINENESTETTTIKDCKTEKEEDGNDADDSTVINSTYGNIYPKDVSNNTQILSQINNVKYRESSNNQQNSQKSCDARNGLILLVENDIKLKLFLNSNGILDELSLVNSRKNSTIKSKNELSSEDDVTSK